MKRPSQPQFIKMFFLGVILLVSACQAQEAPDPVGKTTTTPVLTGQSPTRTNVVSATPTPAPELHPGMLAGPFILEYLPGGEIFIQEVSTGEVRRLDESIKVHQEGFLGWTRKSCGFYARLANYAIVEVDLKGNVIRKVFEIKTPGPLNGETVSPWVALSPSEKLIAYSVGSGLRKEYLNAGYHYEQENVFVMSVDQKDDPYEISQRGGAWVYQWSADSSRLAYTDTDPTGNFQVYIADQQAKQRLQISTIQEAGKAPTKFKWAQDGKFLAILYWNDDSGWDVTIADANTGKQFGVRDVKQMWWGENNVVEMIKGDSILSVNPVDGALQKSVQIPESLVTPSLFGSADQLACLFDCFGNKGPGLYIYDVKKQEVTSPPNFKPIADIEGWEASEPDFPGEANCR